MDNNTDEDRTMKNPWPGLLEKYYKYFAVVHNVQN
jgi:hypothetical protein